MVRFRADETNDMGLAPWGLHEVEFWYSNWALVPPGVMLPRQRDVQRVGKPYKRMTVLQAMINAPAPADSFAISDSLTGIRRTSACMADSCAPSSTGCTAASRDPVVCATISSSSARVG